MTVLGPGTVLAERFALEAPEPELGDGVMRGSDQETQAPIVAFEVPRAWVKPVRPGVGVTHRHLAMLLGDVVTDGAHVLVAERVEGTRLSEELASRRRFAPAEAVKCTLRLAEAIEALHQAGACHGFVHPGAVVVAVQGRSAPVVGWAPPPSGVSPHRSPERGEQGAPSFADDAWAVAAILYDLLIGAAPPAVGIVSEADVRALGVEEADLCTVLAHALAADPAARADLHEIRRELARWYVAHAGDPSEGSGAFALPPPLPPGAASSAPPASPPGVSASVAAPAPQPAPAPARRTWLPFVALAAIVCGLGAAWAASSFRKPEVRVVEREAEPAAAAAASGNAVSLGDVPVTGEEESTTGDKMATCVAGHLPKGAFAKTPDFAWLCDEASVVKGAGKLRTAVVTGAGGQSVTDAMKVFSKLGWYDMAAYAVVRGGCCPPDAKPLEGPEPAEGCEAIAPTVGALARSALSMQPVDAPLAEVAKAFTCAADKKQSHLYGRTAAPAAHEQESFREFLKSLAK